jgi:hypothetical protein
MDCRIVVLCCIDPRSNGNIDVEILFDFSDECRLRRFAGLVFFSGGMPFMYTTFCTPSDGNIIA